MFRCGRSRARAHGWGSGARVRTVLSRCAGTRAARAGQRAPTERGAACRGDAWRPCVRRLRSRRTRRGVHSTPPGRPRRRTAVNAPTEPGQPRARILLVEDEPALVLTLADRLRAERYE